MEDILLAGVGLVIFIIYSYPIWFNYAAWKESVVNRLDPPQPWDVIAKWHLASIQHKWYEVMVKGSTLPFIICFYIYLLVSIRDLIGK